jgi:chromosome segregation ATPase
MVQGNEAIAAAKTRAEVINELLPAAKKELHEAREAFMLAKDDFERAKVRVEDLEEELAKIQQGQLPLEA